MTIVQDMAAALIRERQAHAAKRHIPGFSPPFRAVFVVYAWDAFVADMRGRFGPDVDLTRFEGWDVEPFPASGGFVIRRS